MCSTDSYRLIDAVVVVVELIVVVKSNLLEIICIDMTCPTSIICLAILDPTKKLLSL